MVSSEMRELPQAASQYSLKSSRMGDKHGLTLSLSGIQGAGKD